MSGKNFSILFMLIPYSQKNNTPLKRVLFVQPDTLLG
ncbi:hypothetical protein [Caudoviricetes sp.]|nr:hypothetical protein [Caudoviricetes sp.]